MEPVSVDSKPKGRKGSLDNPEVYENVLLSVRDGVSVIRLAS